MSRPAACGLALLVLGIALAPAAAYVRIMSSKDKPLTWFEDTHPVTFVIQAAGSSDVADASDELAIRRAFDAWGSRPESSLAFAEITDPEERARTDWESKGIHLVLFDEVGDELLFPPEAGVIAVTPVKYQVSTGRIRDADIIFNARDFTFVAEVRDDAFDIRSIAVHEVGHFLGLHHSPLGGATMAPFARRGQFSARSLSQDDVAGIEAAYPASARGVLRGTVRLSGPNIGMPGANVWARSVVDGRVATGGLTDSGGRFELTGLSPGTYEVVASPLDAPLTPGFLGYADEDAFEDGFQPAASDPVVLGQDEVVTGIAVTVAGDSSLRIAGPGTVQTVHCGETVGITMGLFGLVGLRLVEIPHADPAITVSNVNFDPGPNFLTFDVTIAPDAPPGLYDVQVTSLIAQTVASGFLEVVPPPPVLTSIVPECGSEAGGQNVAAQGSELGTAVELILGDSLASDADVVADHLVFASTGAGAPGPVTARIIAASGEEARLDDAYDYAPGPAPRIDSIFPPAGFQLGGTEVVIVGEGFGDSSRVFIGGQQTPSVTLLGSGRISVETPALPLGVHDVMISRIDCVALATTAVGAFTSLEFTDPVLSTVDPGVVAHVGGETITLQGLNFVPQAEVEFFADLSDGTGGLLVPSTYVDAGTLTAEVPPGPLGPASLLVRHPDGQVASLAAAVVYAPLLTNADRVLGDIAGQADTDVAFFDGLAETRLTVTVQRKGKGSLQPTLTLLDPGGVPLVSTDPADPAFDDDFASSHAKRARLRNYTLPSTGRHALVIGGIDDGAGDYQLTFKEKLPSAAKKLQLKKQPLDPGGDITLELMAKAGSLASGKLTGKAGLAIGAVTLTDPDGAPVVTTDAGGALVGDADVLAGLTLDEDGRFLRLKKVPLERFGTYELVLSAADGTSGSLQGSVALKAPKPKIVYEQ